MTLLIAIALALALVLVVLTVREARADRRPDRCPPSSRFVDPAFLPPSHRP